MTGYLTGPKAIREFLDKPGINAAGICNQAGITQQYLLRQLKKGKLPSDEKLERLILVMKEYGFKGDAPLKIGDKVKILKSDKEGEIAGIYAGKNPYVVRILDAGGMPCCSDYEKDDLEKVP